jgi:hypothetical protein
MVVEVRLISYFRSRSLKIPQGYSVTDDAVAEKKLFKLYLKRSHVDKHILNELNSIPMLQDTSTSSTELKKK